MAAANLFYFKHFVIDQANCAMNIGADSMLLGALVSPANAKNILDIGAGTGILSLIMAQKSAKDATIHALEIEDSAYMQALKNASNSSWKNKISVYHTALQQFSPAHDLKYDLIISNPPYFPSTNSPKSKAATQTRATARDQNQLSFLDLIVNTKRLLAADGKFYLILPFSEKHNFIKLAEAENLHLAESINIRSRKESDFIRVILGFSTNKMNELNIHDFTIYETGNIYNKEYLQATKDLHAHDMRKRNR